ncbi:MAG: hypothetical protein J0M04_23995 [Verrucomicrobia bacterium]|nr:hypothetical protein [Verrucomicrobiota bacterium]
MKPEATTPAIAANEAPSSNRMINARTAILGIVLPCLLACGTSRETETVRPTKLNSTCDITISERAFPWDKQIVTVRRKDGPSLLTPIPLSDEAVLAILNTSDFDGSHGRMLGLADCVFQGRTSRCPRGDGYLHRKLPNGSLCEIRTVGPDGYEYVLRVTRDMNGVAKEFRLTKSLRSHPSLRLLGTFQQRQ